MKKSEIRNHFQKEDYPRQTIYDTIKRMQLRGTINDKNKIGRPTPGHLPERISWKYLPITTKV